MTSDGNDSVPEAWGSAAFAEHCLASAFGPRFPATAYAPDGQLATLRTTDMDDEGNINLVTMPRAAIAPAAFTSHLLEPGDLLISRSGTCGIAAVFPGYDLPVVPGAFLIRFRLRYAESAPYFRRYFNSPLGRPRLERLAVGGVQKNLTGTAVLRLRVPLPPPHEMKQISTVLDTVDDTIRKTEQIIAKLKQVKQGLLHDLLTRGIDDNGELRDPDRHPEQFKDSPEGQVPRNWEFYRLAALTALDSPITYGVVKPGAHDEKGVLFVRGGDFPDGRIHINKLRTISRRVDEQYKRTRLRGGELLVSLVGQPGSSAVVPPELAGGNIARQAALVRLREGVNADFVRRHISSNRGQAALLGDTLGSVQQVVNLRDLRELLVPVPGMAEQTRIVECLAQADATSDREQGELEKLKLLKSGLMEDLLTGRVRVTPLLEAGT